MKKISLNLTIETIWVKHIHFIIIILASKYLISCMFVWLLIFFFGSHFKVFFFKKACGGMYKHIYVCVFVCLQCITWYYYLLNFMTRLHHQHHKAISTSSNNISGSRYLLTRKIKKKSKSKNSVKKNQIWNTLKTFL